jgi:hypothetical protein
VSADCCATRTATFFSKAFADECQDWETDITVTMTPLCFGAAQTAVVGLQSVMGMAGGDLNGVAAQTAVIETQAATGTITTTGTIAQTSVVTTQSAAGTVTTSGSISQTSVIETQAATGKMSLTATISQTAVIETQAASGTVTTTGTIDQTAVIENQAASGTVFTPCDANYCEWECQAGGGAWVQTEDNCDTGCECPTAPPDAECTEANQGEFRQLDCVST